MYMIVSVFVPQSLDNEVSGVLFVLNLMEYVLNARSWAASITHTIFFLRSSFLATFTSVPISYVGLLNSPSKSFSCNYFSFLGKLFSCIDLCFTSPIKLLPLSLKYVWVFLFVFVFLLGCLFGDILLMSQSQIDFKFSQRHMTLLGGWVNCASREKFNKQQFSKTFYWLFLVASHKKEL